MKKFEEKIDKILGKQGLNFTIDVVAEHKHKSYIVKIAGLTFSSTSQTHKKAKKLVLKKLNSFYETELTH